MSSKVTQPLADAVEAASPSYPTANVEKANKVADLQDIERSTGKPQTELKEDIAAAGLSRVYQRHGRIDLDPMPSDEPEDPLNWAAWRKNTMLVLVSIHACMGPFAAAATIPAFENFVEEFGISITQASYTVSVQILFLGVFPLLFSPISSRIGRRPMFLASTLLSACLAFACAYCHSYGTLIAVRILQAIVVCPPQSIGAACVTEMFFSHQRGQKMGVWALLVSIGPPLAPLIMGFVVQHKSWHWIFYLLSIIFLAEFVLYIFLGPETLYDRKPRGGVASPDDNTAVNPSFSSHEPASKWYTPYIRFKRHDRTPWSHLPVEVISPLKMFAVLPVFLPAMAYAVTFTYSNVLLTIETPALLGRKYVLNPQQVGLQFIAYLLGALLGEPIAGYGSDKWMQWRTKRAHGHREPEYRLPFALPGFVLIVIGMVVFFVQLNNTAPDQWNVTPLIGGGIAMFGLQLITTVCLTYAVESQASHGPIRARQAAIFVAFWRQIYAFTAPFYFVQAFEGLGFSAAGGLFSALAGAMIFLILATMFMGKRWRMKELTQEE